MPRGLGYLAMSIICVVVSVRFLLARGLTFDGVTDPGGIFLALIGMALAGAYFFYFVRSV